MEDKSTNTPDTGAPNETQLPVEPSSEPVQSPPVSDAATVPPTEPVKPPPSPPLHPGVLAKRDLTSRAVDYVVFNLAVYGLYLFAEAHGYWPLFFIFITAVMFAAEYRYKSRKYKDVQVPPHIAFTSGTDADQPHNNTTQPS